MCTAISPVVQEGQSVAGNSSLYFLDIPYGGKLWWGGGNVGESSMICQTKTIQISTYH